MSLGKPMLYAVAGALALTLAACGGGGDAKSGAKGSAGDATKGKTVFLGTCAACHGPDAKGIIGLGKNLVTPTDWMKKQDDAALVAFIKKGRPASDPLNTTKVDMPPRGGNPAMSDDDIVNVVAYLRTIQK